MAAPVLVIGLDGGVPELLARSMADGSMPALAELAGRGLAAPLEGDELMMEDGLWLSLLSGRLRASRASRQGATMPSRWPASTSPRRSWR